MRNTNIATIIIILVILLIFILPIITMKNKIRTISQLDINEISLNFINDIQKTGKITSEKYNKLKKEIEEIGDNFSIELEFRISDKNSKKEYYTLYTIQIEQELEKNNIYNLKEGDLITITVRNTKLSFKEKIKGFIYKLSGNENYDIITSHSGMVTTNGIAIE